jgi:flagellin-specific chaperone FliS
MRKRIIEFRIALLHATYHRNIRRAERAMNNSNIQQFQKYIYKAEDAWRKIVILTNKIKTNG